MMTILPFLAALDRVRGSFVVTHLSSLVCLDGELSLPLFGFFSHPDFRVNRSIVAMSSIASFGRSTRIRRPFGLNTASFHRLRIS
jgi:hypothetical protein